MKPLTEKQQRVLDFIISYKDEHGFSPTYRDICKGLGYSNIRIVQDEIAALQAKGYFITEKQKQVMDFIISYKDEHAGTSPSYWEICKAIGSPNRQAASHYIEVLREKGYIKKPFGKSRAITVIHPKLESAFIESQQRYRMGPLTRSLTEKQKRVYDFLLEFYDEHGYAPTMKEICQRFGHMYPVSALSFLEALQRKGYITREPRKSRSIGFPLRKKDYRAIEVGFMDGAKKITHV